MVLQEKATLLLAPHSPLNLLNPTVTMVMTGRTMAEMEEACREATGNSSWMSFRIE